MKRLVSIPDVADRAAWIGPSDAQPAWLARHALDGVEVVWCDRRAATRFAPGTVLGMHLPFYADWLDFWRQDIDELDREFGGRDVWQTFFQGTGPDDLIRYYRRALDDAQALAVDYVVFHVSQVSVDETLGRPFRYTDQDVIRAAADAINRSLAPGASDTGTPYTFEFLMENLWWPGLNWRDPDVTRALFDAVEYDRKGFVLDLGHLVTAVGPEHAVPDILRCLDRHGDLVDHIRAVHLHQPNLGDVPPPPAWPAAEDYYDRYRISYEYVGLTDRHDVWTMPGLDRLLRSIAPTYLVYEFRAHDAGEFQRNIARQNAWVDAAQRAEPS